MSGEIPSSSRLILIADVLAPKKPSATPGSLVSGPRIFNISLVRQLFQIILNRIERGQTEVIFNFLI